MTNGQVFMDERLPYMSAYADLTVCGAKAASLFLQSNFKRAADVKNEDCYIIDRKPVISASIKGTTLYYYVFIQNEINLFKDNNLGRFEGILKTTNEDIGSEIKSLCGEMETVPRLSEFMVSMKISKPIP